jgi:nucleotide-binding universal stress UspA family protein
MNNPLRAIIIGVDYSDHSIHAVDEALHAQAARNVRLVPMLVLPGSPATGLPDAEAMTRELVERSKENLSQLLQTRARALGVTLGAVEPRVDFGPPAERLVAAAKARDVELVIVGTHGREGLSHLLLGSVADEVMRKAPCSVLVARARAGEASPRARQDERLRAAARPIASGSAMAAGDMAAGDMAAGDMAAGDLTAGELGGSAEPADAEAPPTIVSEPHIDAGRVVLHVLDPASGQVFECAFQDATGASVEPLEGEWVVPPPSDARARVARIAHDAMRRDRAQFDALFEEIERRRALAH